MSKNFKASIRKERLRQEKHRKRLSRAKKNDSGVPKGAFSDDDHAFWIAHGINYILSDWENGIWNPMFPSIYEGIPVPLDRIAATLVEKFNEQPEWPVEGKAALAWAAVPREIVWVYVLETRRRLKEKGQKPDRANAPHDPTVWKVLNLVVSRVKENS